MFSSTTKISDLPQMDSVDLDKVLEDIGGFGKYQIRRYLLISVLLIFATFPIISYVFTTHDFNYRCYIEGCEEAQPPIYHPRWLRDAVPYEGDAPSRCLRYTQLEHMDGTCDNYTFDRSETIRCTDFVYENIDETTIAKDFGVLCDENLWKLTIVGTINNLGFIAGLPVSGYLSDRFGRRIMMILPVLLSTILGLIKSFTPSYLTFISVEFMEATLGSGAYSASYILGMEMLSAEYRVLGSTILSCIFALGETIMGFVAWYVPVWRTLLRLLYAPGLLLVSYFWLTDESVRWLVSNDKIDEAKVVLKKMAGENGRKLDSNTMKQLSAGGTGKDVNNKSVDSFSDVFKSPVLFLRLLNCCFGWVCVTFVYYGLTMHSVGISGNMYINYIAVALIEIPGYVAVNYTLSRIGRKPSLSYSFLLSGVACFGFVFTPESNTTVRLCMYLLGKFAVTMSYTSIYLYTTELFPTCLRHTFISTCSIFGRIGAMVAPQVPLLAKIYKSLPMILFGSLASIAGLCSFMHPETLGIKLPDTIEEAVNVGNESDVDKS